MNTIFDLSIDISEYDFTKESLEKNIQNNLWVKKQWPLVYFIKNEENRWAYVGESTNAADRILNHLCNKKRAVLKTISIISCDKFNKSATLDIESKLIQYISSEGTFKLQNGNNGLSHHNYYQRDFYENLFKIIWSKLIEKKFVNKSLEEIQNSNFFKYSPYKSLNQDQYYSILEIIEALNRNSSSNIFVKGSAGTGKTILATYLIKLLVSQYEELNTDDIEPENYREVELLYEFRRKYPNPVIGLVIAMTSLRTTLQNVFDKIPGLNRSMIISPSESFKKKYDILIVDEAHRLRQRRNISWMGEFTKNNKKLGLGNEGTELDWIIANSNHQIFFYDSAQSVKPSDVLQTRFEALQEQPATIQLELKSQMRVRAGADYITFVDKLLNCKLKNAVDYFPENYELKFFESLSEMYEELTKRESEHGLCRLVAGYSWPWVTQKKNGGKEYDIEIEGLKFMWNNTDRDWINSETSFREIGCIHTTQGYDLNYVGVIFGKEIKYNPIKHRIEVDPKNYFDRNGKAGIKEPDDLKDYIINIYKTMMYRGIRGTFIYACDENLRSYLQQSLLFKKEPFPFRILDTREAKPYINCVPLYDISAAAGGFSELQKVDDFEWIELPKPFSANRDYFVCRVLGESMNKKIPNGSWCLFRKDTGGSREGKIVLVEHYKIQDKDFGSGFTVKSYHSVKSIGPENWRHSSISLKPLSDNPNFKEINLQEDELSELKVVGIFVATLK